MIGRSRRHRGAALIMALIMLTLMTLLAIATFNMGKTSLEVVGNMQQRDAATAAANTAIEQAISTTRLLDSPDTIFLNPCQGQNTTCVDTNGDGVPDVTVSLVPSPACVRAKVIQNIELDPTNSEDAGCYVGPGTTGFGSGTANNDSLCAASLWEITAVATDNVSQANVTVTEGVTARASKDSTSTSCP